VQSILTEGMVNWTKIRRCRNGNAGSLKSLSELCLSVCLSVCWHK